MDRFTPSEMEIVDAFTHAIFCGSDELSQRELSILDTLCKIDGEAASCSAKGAPRELGAYLSGLGVTEMIQLVGKVRDCYRLQEPLPGQIKSRAARRPPARF